LGHFLFIIPKGMSLFQHPVNQSSFAVVDMGDYSNISDIHIDKKINPPKTFKRVLNLFL